MDFHPSRIPIARTFDVRDEKAASEAADEIVHMGFAQRNDGFKILMPKEKRLAKRIGYTVTTSVNYGLRRTKQDQNIRYWTFHEDNDHYAIVLVSPRALQALGF